MLQSKSLVLENFAGLYTYGQPKVGDAEFAKVFSPHMSSKIFHHAYNNGKKVSLRVFYFFSDIHLYRYRHACTFMVPLRVSIPTNRW